MKVNKYFKALVFMCCALSIPGKSFAENSSLHEGKIQEEQKYSTNFMYGEDDLSSCRLFAGGLINFGFWKEKIKGLISTEERIESEKNMYRFVLEELKITPDDNILEVGCGLGIGSALIVNEFNPKFVKGIDISKEQIDRARTINGNLESKGKLSFQNSPAENLNLNANTFDKVISIEAAQHFTSMKKFIHESYKVIKPKGKIAIVSFFGTSEQSYKNVVDKLETVRDGVDHLTPISDVKQMLENEGFKNIKIKSIGENVWHGYDKWISQLDEFKDTWDANWIKCYKDKQIDYYYISAEK